MKNTSTAVHYSGNIATGFVMPVYWRVTGKLMETLQEFRLGSLVKTSEYLDA